MATIEEIVSRVEGSLEQINARLGNVEAAIIDLRREMTDLHREMTTNFRWTIGTILLMWVTIMGALAGLFGVIFTRLSP